MAKSTHTHCETCLGFGWVYDGRNLDGSPSDCPDCNGTGKIEIKVKSMPTHRTLVARMIRHYTHADDATKDAGRNWYLSAATVAEYLSERYGYSLEQCASVIAVLSPRISWKQNVDAAERAIRCHIDGTPVHEWGIPGYGDNWYKAERILNGDLSALRGPKVTPFSRGIQGDPTACTVDVWMQRAADMDTGKAPTPKEHSAIHKALEAAAVKCGETVRDFQAIVWTQVRGSAA